MSKVIFFTCFIAKGKACLPVFTVVTANIVEMAHVVLTVDVAVAWLATV